MGVSPERDTERAGQAKIRQLEVTVSIDEEVLGFEIAVEDTVAMAIPNAVAKLTHELLDYHIAQAQAS